MSVLLGSTTKPSTNLALGAGAQWAFLLEVASAGTGVKELHVWMGTTTAFTSNPKYGIFSSTASSEHPETLLATAETAGLPKKEELLSLTLSKEIKVEAGKRYWLVMLFQGGSGSVFSLKDGGLRVKAKESGGTTIKEPPEGWKVETAEGHPGAYLEGTPSATESAELKVGTQLESPVKIKRASPELNVGVKIEALEVFSGGVPRYYGPGGEEAAERKKWEEEEQEPASITGTGVRYLYAWKALTKRRVAIFIHGGGDVNNQWRTLEGFGLGSGKYVQAFAPQGGGAGKAGHGLCVFNLNYRDEPSVGPERQLEDIVEGIRYCIEHAAEFNGDPGKVFLVAGSAGVGKALRALQIINAEKPNAIAGLAGFSPYGFDYETTAKEMESGAYREFWRPQSGVKEKSTSTLELTGHGLITGCKIRFTTVPAEGHGLATGTNYWVFRVNANEFRLWSKAPSSTEEKEGTGTITWTAFGAETFAIVEQHPGGSVSALVEKLQVGLNQELNYTGSGFTPAWEPPIVKKGEKTNTTPSRALQRSLSPLNHPTTSQCRFMFIRCEKDLVEPGWVTPTSERLEREAHQVLTYVVTEGSGQEGHSFNSLWGVSKVNPAKPSQLGQEVIFNWIEENIYTVPLETGTQLATQASRTFTAALKVGVQATSQASRTRSATLNTGTALKVIAGRSFAATIQTGTKLTSSASRSRAVTIQVGTQVTAAASRSFASRLSIGTQIVPRTGNNFRVTLNVGTGLFVAASRTATPRLAVGTELAARTAILALLKVGTAISATVPQPATVTLADKPTTLVLLADGTTTAAVLSDAPTVSVALSDA